MSDFEDYATEKLAAHISRVYVALATLCLNLPIPVTLPTGEISNVEAIPAVRRTMDLIIDQPMPEENQAQLFAACALWLGAMDIYGLLVGHEFHSARAHSAAANLLMAEGSMLDIAEWLANLPDGNEG
jgi:hypothetical protein